MGHKSHKDEEYVLLATVWATRVLNSQSDTESCMDHNRCTYEATKRVLPHAFTTRMLEA